MSSEDRKMFDRKMFVFLELSENDYFFRRFGNGRFLGIFNSLEVAEKKAAN